MPSTGACFNVLGHAHAARRERDAEIGLEQRDQVSFRRELMTVSQVEIMAAQQRRKLFGALAMGAAQESLLPQILDIQRRMRRQPVPGVDQQAESSR